MKTPLELYDPSTRWHSTWQETVKAGKAHFWSADWAVAHSGLSHCNTPFVNSVNEWFIGDMANMAALYQDLYGYGKGVNITDSDLTCLTLFDSVGTSTTFFTSQLLRSFLGVGDTTRDLSSATSNSATSCPQDTRAIGMGARIFWL